MLYGSYPIKEVVYIPGVAGEVHAHKEQKTEEPEVKMKADMKEMLHEKPFADKYNEKAFEGKVTDIYIAIPKHKNENEMERVKDSIMYRTTIRRDFFFN